MPADAPGEMPPDRPLVVVGASVRAVAASAARAGWAVHAADLFGDLDLLATTTSSAVVDRYPADLPAAAEQFPPGPWLYTGGLENHLDILTAIARTRPLAGCDAAAVARVREPAELARLARAAGLERPETRPTPRDVPTDGSWLVKPLASAGGRGIRRWHGANHGDAGGERRLWQRHVRGTACSVSYLLEPSGPLLVACSRQLVGRRWCHAGPFAWCGAIDVPPPRPATARGDPLVALGAALADRGLVGLVGVDLVVDTAGRPHVLEVNPRPTASLELAERATGSSLIARHLAACGFDSPTAPSCGPRRGTWSKAVLFAPHAVACDAAFLDTLMATAGHSIAGWPAVADLPRPPQVIPAGRPVCSLFAHAESPRQSLAALRQRTAAVTATLAGWRTAAAPTA